MPGRKTKRFANENGETRCRFSDFSLHLILLLATVLLLTGCTAVPTTQMVPSASISNAPVVQTPIEQASQDEMQTERFIVDSLENTLGFSVMPQRVVALQASLADLWLLAGGELVGVTEDAPERGLAVDGAALVGTTKHPSMEHILSVAPDFVIYSPDIAGQVEAVEILKQLDIPTYACKLDAFSDYLYHLEQFAVLTERQDLYETHGIAVAAEIERVCAAVPSLDNPPTVLFLRAYSSGVKVKSTDHFACDILVDLQADNIAARQPSLLEELSMEIIMQEDPDYILIAFMGEKNEKTMELLETTLFSQPAWQSLSAVSNGRVHELPTELFHYKPNARWAESYQYLYDILYQE